MTAFWIIAALMAAAAIAWVLPVLLRRRDTASDVEQRASNIAILKDHLAELDADLAAGTLQPQQYEQARQDLERRAIEEAREAESIPEGAAPARKTAIGLAVLLPVCATLLYLQLGDPAGISPQAPHGPGKATSQEVEAMVAKLAARMQQTPDDGKGWALLARSYLVMERTAEAVAAYERAISILKDDADVLADYADALAVEQGRRIEGKPLKMVERALKIDPTQWKALAMAGSAAFERNDYKTAVAYWEKLQSRAEAGSDFAREVAANIDEARERGGMTAAAGVAPGMSAAKPQATASTAAAASVDGMVALGREVAGKAAATDTVFVFARAVEGPRMPLAVMRFQVRDLPAKFRLDDSMAMSPASKLSSQSDVIIGARVSKAGSAIPQPGDLQGFSKPVKVGTSGIAVLIDQVVP
jgi:cytochrome c-type biogenesis protein CcmH